MKRARYLAYCIAILYAVFAGWEVKRTVVLDQLPNGCLVNALEFECAVTAEQGLSHVTWARLVRVSLRDGWHLRGHAMCVYSLRNGDLWVYDILSGSQKLDTREHDRRSVADSLHRLNRRIYFLQFID